jgi:tetratricopeptide (TPR) repeat protein
MARKFCPLLLLSFLLLPVLFAQQQQQLANIFGQLRVARGDFPSHQIMIELRFRGSTINNTYADTEGKFGFNNLVGGEYHIIINDEAYDALDERLFVRPDISANVMAFITLRPREGGRVSEAASSRDVGSNPNMLDLREYNRRFPKKAVKEYDKGLDADRAGKREQAISHYQTALQIAPGYYPAHNNLGSDYLSKADFANARREFDEVVRLNQSDATGYFNLSNVCMLMGEMGDAQKYLEEGMRRQPDSALGHFLLGSLDIRLGRFAEAESALRQTIQLDPAMTQARLQLVNLLMKEGRKADAVAQLHDFVSAFPGSPYRSQATQLLQQLETSSGSAPVQ